MLGSKIAKVLLCCSLLAVAAPAWAQRADQEPPVPPEGEKPYTLAEIEPNPASVPFFDKIIKEGGKVFYYGDRSGLHGWLMVKDGHVQMAYSTRDDKTVLLGAMLTANGDNVTARQVVDLIERNQEAGDLIAGSMKQQGGPRAQASLPDTFGAASAPAPAPAPAPVSAAPKAPEKAVSLSPGEQLLGELKAAGGVTLGKNPNVEIVMVMDPSCPNCRETWRALQPHVMANEVQVRMVPVHDLTIEDVRVAGLLLKVEDPLTAWNKYIAGDKSGFVGDPEAAQMQAIQSNRNLLDKWKIKATPYIVYRGKDGKVKIVVGKPAKIDELLADLPK